MVLIMNAIVETPKKPAKRVEADILEKTVRIMVDANDEERDYA